MPNMSEMNELKIISLDASSSCTGYSQFILNFDTSSISHVKTASVKSSKKELYARILHIDKYFESENLYGWCDVAIFENYAFKGNRITQLAELNGILKYNFYINNKKIEVIAPNSIKKLVTGNGHAKKDVVKDFLLNLDLFKNLEFKNNDESDSLAVGYAYIIKTLKEMELDGKE